MKEKFLMSYEMELTSEECEEYNQSLLSNATNITTNTTRFQSSIDDHVDEESREASTLETSTTVRTTNQ